MSLSEFFGFGGYSRPAEGYMSWQHLLFVTLLNIAMIVCAVLLGRKYKNADAKAKNKVLIWTAFLINAFEIFKIVILSIRHGDPLYFRFVLPLFLCSIQLITIPIAAFSKGKAKEASLDFVMIFGILGAVLGTYFAGNNYAVYPVIGMDNVISGITHCLAGFASLYIMFSGMISMKKYNIIRTVGIISVFCVAAYVANIFWDCNYMFLSRGDGTPYDIFENLVGGHPVFYPLIVVLLFALYITVYYHVFYLIRGRVSKKSAVKSEEKEPLNV